MCGLGIPYTLGGQNVPTKMAISKILVLVGAFLVPMRKQAYKSYRNSFLGIWLYIENTF